MDKHSYEWHEINSYKLCSACRKKMIFHGYRRPMKGKKEVVYFHCQNHGCSLYGVETPPLEVLKGLAQIQAVH